MSKAKTESCFFNFFRYFLFFNLSSLVVVASLSQKCKTFILLWLENFTEHIVELIINDDKFLLKYCFDFNSVQSLF